MAPAATSARSASTAAGRAATTQARAGAGGGGGRGPATPAGADVAVIPIHGMIYSFTLKSLKHRAKLALKSGASMIVLEMNTPGGVVTSALKICTYIKKLPVPTTAWVHDEAYSGGILVASACDHLIMSPASATGDCAPIVPGRSLAPTERAKALSPILAQFRDNARDNGYDYTLFHAMCVLGVKVYQIQNPETGERRLVNQLDYKVMVEGQDPGQIAKQSGTSVASFLGFTGKGGGKGGAKGGKAAAVAGPTLTATDADRGRWRLIRKVHDGKTLLTLHQTEARKVGLSKGTVGSLAALKKYLGAASIHVVSRSWSSNLAEFLINPIVRGVLVVALLVGAFIEFQSPGLGVGGVVAVVSLLLLLGAPFVIGLAQIWHILAFLIGFVLLIVEIAFVPGFGLVGLAGLALMFIGLVLSVVPAGSGGQYGPVNLPPPQMWHQAVVSSVYLIAAVVTSLVLCFFLGRHFGRIPLLNQLVLSDEGAGPRPAAAGVSAEGPVGVPFEAGRPPTDVSGGAAVASATGMDTLGAGHLSVGDVGESISPLRPGGHMQIEGQVANVVSVGDWIPPGRKVKVVEVRGNRIVVDEVREQP